MINICSLKRYNMPCARNLKLGIIVSHDWILADLVYCPSLPVLVIQFLPMPINAEKVIKPLVMVSKMLWCSKTIWINPQRHVCAPYSEQSVPGFMYPASCNGTISSRPWLLCISSCELGVIAIPPHMPLEHASKRALSLTRPINSSHLVRQSDSEPTTA